MRTKKLLLLLAFGGLFMLSTYAQDKGPVPDDPPEGNSAITTIQIDNKDISLKLYPNPAVNELNIKRTSQGVVTFNLYNITGEKVICEKLIDENTKINVSTIPAGRYIYRITNDDNLLSNGMISVIK